MLKMSFFPLKNLSISQSVEKKVLYSHHQNQKIINNLKFTVLWKRK